MAESVNIYLKVEIVLPGRAGKKGILSWKKWKSKKQL